jgi:hypothetical protein
MKQVYYALAPWHFVGALLVFLLVVPTLLVAVYKSAEESYVVGCGNATPPALLPDEDAAAETLFQQNCASCHNPIKDATGPALAGILDGRGEGFLYRFLVARKRPGKDRLIKKRVAQFGLECSQFSHLTREDVARLEGFIKRKSVYY